MIRDRCRPAFPAGCPACFRQLAERCWDELPESRPSMQEVEEQLTAVQVRRVAAVRLLQGRRMHWLSSADIPDRQAVVPEVPYLSKCSTLHQRPSSTLLFLTLPMPCRACRRSCAPVRSRSRGSSWGAQRPPGDAPADDRRLKRRTPTPLNRPPQCRRTHKCNTMETVWPA